MSKQHHYVVFYDTETKKWNIDFDISLNRDRGSIWNKNAQEWESTIGQEKADDIFLKELTEKLETGKE